MSLPSAYAWLSRELGPKMLVEALKLYGTREVPGDADNPEIIAWAAETGLSRTYRDDVIPWCGLFMAVVAKRAGKPIPATPLWARSWAEWGTASPRASLGDVLVFSRQGGGHVGLYVGEDAMAYHVLGGNQSDAVTITRIAKSRCIAVRRLYAIGAPANVRPVRLTASGDLSTNEA